MRLVTLLLLERCLMRLKQGVNVVSFDLAGEVGQVRPVSPGAAAVNRTE